MKKYFYSDGENQFGPFSFDELQNLKLSRNTLIWFEGLDDWKIAENIPELKSIFDSMPPPLKPKTPPPPISKPLNSGNKITYSAPTRSKHRIRTLIIIGASLLFTVAVFYFFATIIISNNNSNSDNFDQINETEFIDQQYQEESTYNPPPKQKTEQELRHELYKKEKSKPKEYLSATYKLTYKVFSGKDQITGTIYNSASMATFKDVVLTVNYLTNTNSLIRSEDFVVYEYINPGSSTTFNIKTYSPDGTKKIGLKIKSAISE